MNSNVLNEFPAVQGICPACESHSLFLGADGYVTCSRLDCPQPLLLTDMLEDGRLNQLA